LVPTGLVAEGGSMVQVGGAIQVLVALHENGTPLMVPLAWMVSVPAPPPPV
jgi:hypothetical protein